MKLLDEPKPVSAGTSAMEISSKLLRRSSRLRASRMTGCLMLPMGSTISVIE